MVLPQIDSFKREPTSSPSGDQSIHSDDTTTIMWSANEFEPTNYDPQYSFAYPEQSYSSLLDGNMMDANSYGANMPTYSESPMVNHTTVRPDYWGQQMSPDVPIPIHQDQFAFYSTYNNVHGHLPTYQPETEMSSYRSLGPDSAINKATQPVYNAEGPYYYSHVSINYERKTHKARTKARKNTKRPLTSDEAAQFTEKQRLELTPNHKNSIHLWQFLAELLNQDKWKCIKWIERDQGIFKIEDSQEVAKLWGLRKNRPNMNYDKLSRSIRQYYKKGIIRKPSISSRLVYQFCEKILKTLSKTSPSPTQSALALTC